MRVVEVARETALARVAEDERVRRLLAVVDRNRESLAIVLHAIRYFHNANELRFGRPGDGRPNLRVFVRIHIRKGGRGSRNAADQVVRYLEGLYNDYEPGNVRGALLEALVEYRLRDRYRGTGCLLRNNLRFELQEGRVTLYSSGDHSIDVIGFDGRVGECHDCKVDSRRFEKRWIDELEREVHPHGFMIGLATSHYEPEARRNLKEKGIRL